MGYSVRHVIDTDVDELWRLFFDVELARAMLRELGNHASFEITEERVDETGLQHRRIECRSHVPERVLIILDEAYFEYAKENPRYPDGPVTMLYCGADAKAKSRAAQLASDLGFDPVDAGGLSAARWLEDFAMLWIHLAIHQKLGVNFAFRLVRR